MRLFFKNGINTVRRRARFSFSPLVFFAFSFALFAPFAPSRSLLFAVDTQPSNNAPPIAKWFWQLGDADPQVREAASVNLMGLRPEDLPQLQKLVAESLPLPPAQATVLRQIVEQIYLAGESYKATPGQGFLGIQTMRTTVKMDSALDDHPFFAIVVYRRVPGFCGARALRDGDVILGVIERPNLDLTDVRDFSTAVREIGPRQLIHLQVLRHGQVREVPVTLDPRPMDIDIDTAIDAMVEMREAKFREYWEQSFGPLLKEQTGGA